VAAGKILFCHSEKLRPHQNPERQLATHSAVASLHHGFFAASDTATIQYNQILEFLMKTNPAYIEDAGIPTTRKHQ